MLQMIKSIKNFWPPYLWSKIKKLEQEYEIQSRHFCEDWACDDDLMELLCHLNGISQKEIDDSNTYSAVTIVEKANLLAVKLGGKALDLDA